MKQILLFFVMIYIYANTYGQDTYIGKLVFRGSAVAYSLESTPNDYVLTLNHSAIMGSMVIDNVEYFKDDIVAITGTTMPLRPDIPNAFYLEIESIKKWSPNPEIQHFVGIYLVEGICEELSGFSQMDTKGIIIKEGIESDLLINDLEAFVIDNSFYIPYYFSNTPPVSTGIEGKGEIINDSLFLHYTQFMYGIYGRFDCNYKGTKIRYSDSITVLPAIATTDDEFLFVAYSKSRKGDCTLELSVDSIVGNTVYIGGKYDGSTACITGNGKNDTISLGSEFEQGTYNVVYSIIDTQSPETAEVLNTSFEVIPIIYGCTDATAINYDSEATEDDGSCDYGTAVETAHAPSLRIYPNPSTGELTITGVGAEQITQSVEIYDNAGHLVETHSRASLHGNGLTINISHLPNGVYFIQINGKRVGVVKK